MDNKDLLKELESLKKRVSELESLKKSNLNMFGRSYSLAGNSDSDFLIKTKGQVKIQWGNKFIDLIKDGKINVDSSFIFKVKSEDRIGVKDGIYLTDDGMVYLLIGDLLINLVGEIGNTYVSFLGEQRTESNSKYTALKNIGFLYSDMNSFGLDSLQNGIIYIESELKLYIVSNGQLSEFGVAFPNPFNELFVILKNDANTGALLIKGSGITNSLAFDSFYIFTEEGDTYLRSDGEINIMIDEKSFINVTRSKTTIKNIVEANTFQSAGASKDNGFILYLDNNGSTLIVDNLIVRKGSNEDHIDPIEWSYGKNLITNIDTIIDENTEEISYAITLKYENIYKVGDLLYFYVDISSEEVIEATKVPVKIIAFDVETPNVIYVLLLNELESLLDDVKSQCINRIISLVGTNLKITTIRKSEKAIDVVECLTIEEEGDIASVVLRQGNLSELNLKEKNKVNGEIPIKGNGIYAALGYFRLAGYIHDYELPDEDDSTRFASTEWVNKKISSLNIDIDLTIRLNDDDLDIISYFSKPEILKLLLDLEVGTAVSYLGLFGIITIAKSDRDYTFSAIVRAITDNQQWSHRSITGSYDSLTNVWYGTSTYIIKDLFNPGYYWAKEIENSKPISPEYIGTVNTVTVSEAIPYILYTNDGKVWKLIDEYIVPDPNLVYFSASGLASCNLQNAQTVPMGFVGIVKTDGTNYVNIGKSNYASSTFDIDDPITGDIRGQIPKATRAILINALKDALPGVIPSIPGLPTLFFIKKSDITTIPENSIHKLKSFETGIDLTTVFNNAKILVRNIIQSLCRWTNSVGLKYNTTHPGTYKSIGDIEFWKNSLNIRILAGDILCEILKSVPNINASEAINAIYSDTVGFAQSWTATHWENFNFFQMSGVCESSFSPPADDDNNAKAGLKMDNSISIICDNAHIYGELSVTYRDYKWPEAPDPNYPYLSAVWAIDDTHYIDKVNRLPYPVNINLNLIFNGADGKYKIEGTVGNTINITPI